MKANYKELKNRPRTLQSLTGLKVNKYKTLVIIREVLRKKDAGFQGFAPSGVKIKQRKKKPRQAATLFPMSFTLKKEIIQSPTKISPKVTPLKVLIVANLDYTDYVPN